MFNKKNKILKIGISSILTSCMAFTPCIFSMAHTYNYDLNSSVLYTQPMQSNFYKQYDIGIGTQDTFGIEREVRP